MGLWTHKSCAKFYQKILTLSWDTRPSVHVLLFLHVQFLYFCPSKSRNYQNPQSFILCEAAPTCALPRCQVSAKKKYPQFTQPESQSRLIQGLHCVCLGDIEVCVTGSLVLWHCCLPCSAWKALSHALYRIWFRWGILEMLTKTWTYSFCTMCEGWSLEKSRKMPTLII